MKNTTRAGFEYYLEMHKKPLTIIVVAAFVVLLVLGLIGANARMSRMPSLAEGNLPLGDAIRTGQAPAPAYTDEVKAKLSASLPFSMLVSYTDKGFEPTIVTVKAGERVRFSNNSSAGLWVAATGSGISIYPRTGESCGSSDLDSCKPFSPQDFWEFTFEKAGEWHVTNNLNKEMTLIVRVQ
jgi:plastocyanin